MVGDTPAGLGAARGHGDASSPRFGAAIAAEQAGNPLHAGLAGLEPPAATWRARRSASASPTRRSGPSATTAASNGSVNAMHDSFTPLGGWCRCGNMQLGEVVFGGVGSGLYGMLVFVSWPSSSPG
jgi:potassium-transporting ATPase potassium-binding subunit